MLTRTQRHTNTKWVDFLHINRQFDYHDEWRKRRQFFQADSSGASLFDVASYLFIFFRFYYAWLCYRVLFEIHWPRKIARFCWKCVPKKMKRIYWCSHVQANFRIQAEKKLEFDIPTNLLPIQKHKFHHFLSLLM